MPGTVFSYSQANDDEVKQVSPNTFVPRGLNAKVVLNFIRFIAQVVMRFYVKDIVACREIGIVFFSFVAPVAPILFIPLKPVAVFDIFLNAKAWRAVFKMEGIEIAGQTDGGIAVGFSSCTIVEIPAKNSAVSFPNGPYIAEHYIQINFVGFVFFVIKVDDSFFRSNENIGLVESIDVLESGKNLACNFRKVDGPWVCVARCKINHPNFFTAAEPYIALSVFVHVADFRVSYDGLQKI